MRPPVGAARRSDLKTTVSGLQLSSIPDFPYGFAFLPDGRILITEQSGSLRVVEKGRLLPDAIVDAPTGGIEGQHGQPGH